MESLMKRAVPQANWGRKHRYLIFMASDMHYSITDWDLLMLTAKKEGIPMKDKMIPEVEKLDPSIMNKASEFVGQIAKREGNWELTYNFSSEGFSELEKSYKNVNDAVIAMRGFLDRIDGCKNEYHMISNPPGINYIFQ